ncbi:hypothetical protein RRF57_010141 [Xylaria bambusicola]|uniref:Uncharacterized protein n=1 Tax=Xylaria bambusicola TaxID=326684 RepID=A0AAN7UW67_9PEZI
MRVTIFVIFVHSCGTSEASSLTRIVQIFEVCDVGHSIRRRYDLHGRGRKNLSKSLKSFGIIGPTTLRELYSKLNV